MSAEQNKSTYLRYRIVFHTPFATNKVKYNYIYFVIGGSIGWEDMGSPPPLKFTKVYGFLAILVQIPKKSQRYRDSIQYWAIIGQHTDYSII